MGKIGRNDSCPCGSGKKYKKCCLARADDARREQWERQRAREEASRPPEGGDREVVDSYDEDHKEAPDDDPGEDAGEAWWESFHEAGYEGQVQKFYETLEEPELADAMQVLDVLEVLYRATGKHQERDRFEVLVQALRERCPDFYAEYAPYYLDWMIANALLAGRREVAAAMAMEMAEHAGNQVDIFFRTLDRLVYHGQMATLLRILPVALPVVKGSERVLPWTSEILEDLARMSALFDHLERFPEADARDEALVEVLRPYGEFETDYLAAFLDALASRNLRIWAVDEFVEAGRAMRREVFRERISQLSVEFLGFLRRTHGVAWTKGNLARRQISEYLVSRFEGNLASRSRGADDFAPPRKHRKKKPRPRVDHPLCPDLPTLDRFLGSLVERFNPQYYKMAITVEMMPAWLNFLTMRGLLDRDLAGEALPSILPLKQSTINVLEDWGEDPTLGENIQRAWASYREASPHFA